MANVWLLLQDLFKTITLLITSDFIYYFYKEGRGLDSWTHTFHFLDSCMFVATK